MRHVKQVGIIGLGKFGFKLGTSLVKLGQEVVGIDRRPENVRQAQHELHQVYEADATDKEALAQLGFADFDYVLVSVGDSIAASSMISMYLKELEVDNVWVKAVNTDHEKLLRTLGVDEVIIPEHMAAKQMANRIAIPGFIDYLPFDTHIILQELPVSAWEDKSLRELDLTNRFDIQILAIRQAGSREYGFLPKADAKLRKGDVLVALGPTEQLARIKP